LAYFYILIRLSSEVQNFCKEEEAAPADRLRSLKTPSFAASRQPFLFSSKKTFLKKAITFYILNGLAHSLLRICRQKIKELAEYLCSSEEEEAWHPCHVPARIPDDEEERLATLHAQR